MTIEQDPQAPETLEGWYVLHDVYRVNWARWRELDAAHRADVAAQAGRWLDTAAGVEQGDSAGFSVISQKGDLIFVHYRSSLEEINRVELSLRQIELFEYLLPAYSYFSVIELGMYELTAVVSKKLAEQGIVAGSDEYTELYAKEMEKQQPRVRARLFPDVPDKRYLCFYPMNKRRGEQVNWYALSMAERRDMMRGHGRIGHKYHEQITQVIGGSVGLDDWEWGVTLYADDALQFKKLIYEMRFDPASALFAEFGPFYVGIRIQPARIADVLTGRLP